MSKKKLFFIIAVLLLFVYGWIVKNFELNFLGLFAGTFIYTSIIQFLFTRWVDEV